MTAINTDIYALASRDADTILGAQAFGGGRGRTIERVADADPLAWWCLVELLVSYSRPAELQKRIAREMGRQR